MQEKSRDLKLEVERIKNEIAKTISNSILFGLLNTVAISLNQYRTHNHNPVLKEVHRSLLNARFKIITNEKQELYLLLGDADKTRQTEPIWLKTINQLHEKNLKDYKHIKYLIKNHILNNAKGQNFTFSLRYSSYHSHGNDHIIDYRTMQRDELTEIFGTHPQVHGPKYELMIQEELQKLGLRVEYYYNLGYFNETIWKISLTDGLVSTTNDPIWQQVLEELHIQKRMKLQEVIHDTVTCISSQIEQSSWLSRVSRKDQIVIMDTTKAFSLAGYKIKIDLESDGNFLLTLEEGEAQQRVTSNSEIQSLTDRLKFQRISSNSISLAK